MIISVCLLVMPYFAMLKWKKILGSASHLNHLRKLTDCFPSNAYPSRTFLKNPADRQTYQPTNHDKNITSIHTKSKTACCGAFSNTHTHTSLKFMYLKPFLSAAGHTSDCALGFVCLSVCHQFYQQAISKTNLWIFCKIYSRQSLHTTPEMINFWCTSHSRWLRMNGPEICNFHMGQCLSSTSGAL